jgi:hypothetical protein
MQGEPRDLLGWLQRISIDPGAWRWRMRRAAEDSRSGCDGKVKGK